MWPFSRRRKGRRVKTDESPTPSPDEADSAPEHIQEVGVAVPDPAMDTAVTSLNTVVFADYIRLDKRAGQGEDANPIVSLRQDQVVLGVFDGLGGAGAEAYETREGKKTGAAIGAAIAAHVSRRVLESPDGPADVGILKAALADGLQRNLQSLGGESSALKGRLIRKLPTTVAIARVSLSSAQSASSGHVCTTFWAGDSRVYVLDCHGLRQLTRDHLAIHNDAMQNLLQDSELSNCARADGEFYLESADIEVGPSAFLVIAASDGVFGYLPTPMHFENLLLQTIAGSHSFTAWKTLLEQRIASYTQDDATLAYSAIGWNDFASMKESLERRRHEIASETERIDRAAEKVQTATAAATVANAELDTLRQSIWDAYRPAYELTGSTEQS